MTELKPCLFCGRTPRVMPRTCDKDTPYNPADRAFPVIRCGCGISLDGEDWKGPESLIARWNALGIKGAAPAPQGQKQVTKEQIERGLDAYWQCMGGIEPDTTDAVVAAIRASAVNANAPAPEGQPGVMASAPHQQWRNELWDEIVRHATADRNAQRERARREIDKLIDAAGVPATEPDYDWKAIAEHYESALRHLAENAFASKDWRFARAALNAGTAAAKRMPAGVTPLDGGQGVMASGEVQRQLAIEAKAREIYDGWKHKPGWVPWVEGGNSHRQDDARRIAATPQASHEAQREGGDDAEYEDTWQYAVGCAISHLDYESGAPQPVKDALRALCKAFLDTLPKGGT